MTDIKPLDYLRAIRDARDLTSSERLVAVMVMSHAGPTGRKSHPGIPLLMFETGLSDKTIRRALKSLEAKKWLVLTYSGHGGDQAKANEYDLNIPSRIQCTVTQAVMVTGWETPQPVIQQPQPVLVTALMPLTLMPLEMPIISHRLMVMMLRRPLRGKPKTIMMGTPRQLQ